MNHLFDDGPEYSLHGRKQMHQSLFSGSAAQGLPGS